MEGTIPPIIYLVGVGSVLVGIMAILFAEPMGRFNECIANRFLPEALRDVVMEEPFGMNMKRRNIVGGAVFLLFGVIYLWILNALPK